MSKEVVSKQLLSRRAVIFGAANLATMSVLLGRLYYLQFFSAQKYTTLAEGNRVKIQMITPVRGLLLDKNGIPLATNEKNFRLFLDTEAVQDISETMKELSDVITLSQDRIDAIIEQARGNRYTPPILIKEHLTWDELSQFEFFHLRYPGIYVDIGQVRYYPLSDNAAHLIGYVGAVAENEMSSQQKMARLPDFRIGKAGVEKMLEAQLCGSAGLKQTEVNVHAMAVRDLGRQEGKPGQDIRLTVDSRLQEYASARFGDESGGGVVMNVHNGDVLALVSMPAFDPNSFTKGITAKYWGALQANVRNPLMNKAIAGQYPPGSTFKMTTALAALEEGVISTESRVSCNGTFYYGNHAFTCWKTQGHGSVNLNEAIAQSCDVFFYTMADRLGIDLIAEMARTMGMGKNTGLGLPGEKNGIVPDDKWKRARYGIGWQGGDTINVGIGQGYILATPLQLAVMASRIANGGLAVNPRLVAPGGAEKPLPSLGINDAAIAAVQEGMNSVTNSTMGTAYGHRITEERFAMAGKTGTSQVRKLLQHGMDQNKLPWEARHHAWFVGYAPVSAPKYAAAVIVEHGGGGAVAAAPIVRDILLKIQSLDAGEPGAPVPPKTQQMQDEEDD